MGLALGFLLARLPRRPPSSWPTSAPFRRPPWSLRARWGRRGPVVFFRYSHFKLVGGYLVGGELAPRRRFGGSTVTAREALARLGRRRVRWW